MAVSCDSGPVFDPLPSAGVGRRITVGGRRRRLAGFRHPAIIYRPVEIPCVRKAPGVTFGSGRLLAWKAAYGEDSGRALPDRGFRAGPWQAPPPASTSSIRDLRGERRHEGE